MTQQTERDALRKLAEAATPGPWAFGTFHRLLVVQADKHGYADKHSAIADIGAGSIPWDETAESMQEYNDAEYIAAANPAAVITLLDQLQSQAERIKELEKQHIERLLRIEKEVDVLVAERDELREKYTDTYWALDDAARENTSLRAQLAESISNHEACKSANTMLLDEIAAIDATEPVAEVGGTFTLYWVGSGPIEPIVKKYGIKVGDKLFTRPMPAQDVTELVDALKDVAQTLAWMQHGKCRGFSDGLLTTDEALDKARTALAK